MTLLAYVGKAGYRDPACDLARTRPVAGRPHGPKDQRQSACDLAFGTSTGAMGFRKFPNPRIRSPTLAGRDGLARIVGGLRQAARHHGIRSESQPAAGRLDRAAVSSSAWRAAPATSPSSPESAGGSRRIRPGRTSTGWSATSTAHVGDPGLGHVERTASSGRSSRTRGPGTVDTSAVAERQVSNPGHDERHHQLRQRRPTSARASPSGARPTSCAAGADADNCWCEPGRDNKCWLRGDADRDRSPTSSRAARTASACSKRCSASTSTSARARSSAGSTTSRICGRPIRRSAGSARRRSTSASAGATARTSAPSRIGCRTSSTSCFSERPADLYVARGLPSRDALDRAARREFGTGAVERGREVFAAKCARCHSSEATRRSQQDRFLRDGRRPTGPAQGFSQQRAAAPGHRDRHRPCARAALQPHEGARVGAVRIGDAARPSAGAGHCRAAATAAAATIGRSRS